MGILVAWLSSPHNVLTGMWTCSPHSFLIIPQVFEKGKETSRNLEIGRSWDISIRLRGQIRALWCRGGAMEHRVRNSSSVVREWTGHGGFQEGKWLTVWLPTCPGHWTGDFHTSTLSILPITLLAPFPMRTPAPQLSTPQGLPGKEAVG